MSVSERHLEEAYKKAIHPLMDDAEKAVVDYNKHTYEKGVEAGIKAAKISGFLKAGGIAFGITAALVSVIGYINWQLTHFPATECPSLDCEYEEYCPMPSKAHWFDNVNTREKFLEYEFEDGTYCWKKEGSGTAVCILP